MYYLQYIKYHIFPLSAIENEGYLFLFLMIHSHYFSSFSLYILIAIKRVFQENFTITLIICKKVNNFINSGIEVHVW